MFREITINDIGWIEDCIKDSDCLSCDYSPFNIYGWKNLYKTEIDRMEDCLICRLNIDEKWHYLFPCGSGDIISALDTLEKYHNDNFDYPLIFMCNKKQIEYLGDAYSIELKPGYYDYVYNTIDLIELKGAKYHGKRNHIAQFNKKYDWKFVPINNDNLADAEKLVLEWYEATGSEDVMLELNLLRDSVKYSDKFNIVSGLLYANYEPAALSVASFPGNDTLDIHIEKGNTKFSGVYAKIMNESVKYAYSVREFSYVNREEDLGLDNLKKSKLSLHPAFLEEKFVCIKKDII